MADWDGTVILTTPRLLLRRFRRDDLPLYAALNTDPEVARYLGGPLSRQDSDDIAAWAQECHDRREAEIEDMGQVFQAVVYSITAERWRGARQR